MTLEKNEFRDPGEVVATVAAQRPLRDGDVRVVIVRDPSVDQEVVQVVRLARSRWRDLDRHELSEYLATTAERLHVPRRGVGRPPRHSMMTIVARRGLAVIGPAEARWLIAW